MIFRSFPLVLPTVLLMVALSNAQVLEGGSCPIFNSEVKGNFNFEKFMGRWYEVMQTWQSSGNLNYCSQYIFEQISSTNFTFFSYARNSKNESDIFSQGESTLTTDSNGNPAFKIRDNGNSLFIIVIDTDYVNYAVLWSCIPTESAHYEITVVLTRLRFPPLDTLRSTLDVLSLKNLSTAFLISVEHLNCPKLIPHAPVIVTSAPVTYIDTTMYSSSTQRTTSNDTSEATSTSTPNVSNNSTILVTMSSISETVMTITPPKVTNSSNMNYTIMPISNNTIMLTSNDTIMPTTNSTIMTTASTTSSNIITVYNATTASPNIINNTRTNNFTVGLSTWWTVLQRTTSASPEGITNLSSIGSTTGSSLITWTSNLTVRPTILPTPPHVKSSANKYIGPFLQILFCWLLIEFIISYNLTGSFF